MGSDCSNRYEKEAIPTVNRSVMTIDEAQSHHCRLSTFRARDQKDGSYGVAKVPAKLVGVTFL